MIYDDSEDTKTPRAVRETALPMNMKFLAYPYLSRPNAVTCSRSRIKVVSRIADEISLRGLFFWFRRVDGGFSCAMKFGDFTLTTLAQQHNEV